jgi:hypothetical protein
MVLSADEAVKVEATMEEALLVALQPRNACWASAKRLP